MLEIFNDSTANITNYKIENDSKEPNKLINFTIGPMLKDEGVLIHFSFWVLVENHDFSDLPGNVEFPEVSDLPDETKKWIWGILAFVVAIIIALSFFEKAGVAGNKKGILMRQNKNSTFERLNISPPNTFFQLYINSRRRIENQCKKIFHNSSPYFANLVRV